MLFCCYDGFVCQVNLTTQPQPFGENHEKKIPKGADLSLQGVLMLLGGFCILILDKARSFVMGRREEGSNKSWIANLPADNLLAETFFSKEGGTNNDIDTKTNINFNSLLDGFLLSYSRHK